MKPCGEQPEAALPGVWSTIIRVRAQECDADRKLKIRPLLHYLQNLAADHADALGVGQEALSGAGKAWILVRLHLKLQRPPEYGDVLQCRTWPAGHQGVLVRREYSLQQGEEILVRGSSGWVLMDLKKGRPLRPQPYLETIPVLAERALAGDFPILPEMAHPEVAETRSAHHDDLDVYAHVNHAEYVQWALELSPDPRMSGWKVAEIEAAFSGMVHGGETVQVARSASAEDGTCYLYRIMRANGNRDVTRLRIRYLSPSHG